MKFYFDMREGANVVTDDSGVELPDLNAAVREAIRTATDVAKEFFLAGGDRIAIDIREGDEPRLSVVVQLAKLAAKD